MTEKTEKTEDKKTYATPTLTTHGSAEKLTQLVPHDGSGYTPPPTPL